MLNSKIFLEKIATLKKSDNEIPLTLKEFYKLLQSSHDGVMPEDVDKLENIVEKIESSLANEPFFKDDDNNNFLVHLW